MELPYGKGQVVWSNLDLEDHFVQDVVAATMAARLIRYIDTLRPLPRTTELILLGTAKDAALLDDLGLVYRKNDQITEKTGLLIVGEIDALQQEAVTAFARRGGNVLASSWVRNSKQTTPLMAGTTFRVGPWQPASLFQIPGTARPAAQLL
jgi:hypothetical protein